MVTVDWTMLGTNHRSLILWGPLCSLYNEFLLNAGAIVDVPQRGEWWKQGWE